MDRGHASGPTGATAAARHGKVDADARARDQAAGSLSLVSGPASRDTTATDGAERRGVGGSESDREGGRFRVRLFVPSWRRRTTREVLAAGDAERERVAQDLPDGVQQRLTALRIELGVAADRFGERGETEAGAVLQAFGDDVDRVIDEVRDLAHGMYPALLSSFGLAAALVSVGVQPGRAVTVHASGVRRCRPEVEVAVYSRALPRLTTRPSTPDRCPSRLTFPTPVARWTSRSATRARGSTRPKRSSARGSRTCATASPPSAGRSRLTRRRRAEPACMAACRTPAGNNRARRAGRVGLPGSERARRRIMAVSALPLQGGSSGARPGLPIEPAGRRKHTE